VADAAQLFWSLEHREPCRLLDSQGLWGQRYLRVWLPQSDAIVRVAADSVVPLDEAAPMSAEQLAYVTSAARVAQALTQDVLLVRIPRQAEHRFHAKANTDSTARRTVIPRQGEQFPRPGVEPGGQ
jgi:hypothetical protein